jgi:hypothetical protein
VFKEGDLQIAHGGWKAAAPWLPESISPAYNVMAVDPDSLAVTRCPMARFPHIVGTAYVITGAASIVRAVANFDCHRAWITTPVIRTTTGISTAVVRSVPRVGIGAVIASASYQAQRCGN